MKAFGIFYLVIFLYSIGFSQEGCVKPSVDGPRKVCKGAVIELIGSNAHASDLNVGGSNGSVSGNVYPSLLQAVCSLCHIARQ